MRALVAVKQVPDTSKMSLDADGNLIRAGVPSILDPYSETALARVLSAVGEGDSVTAVSMGPPQAERSLRRCLELGADRAVLLTDRDFSGADVWATARTLAAFISKDGPYDLIAFGRQAIDGDTGQVPYEVAQLLDVQQFAYTREVRRSGAGLEAVQDYGDVIRTARVPAGSVVAFGEVDPNGLIPTVAGHLSAMDREIERMDRVQLGLGLYSVGSKGSRTSIRATRYIDSARRNRKVKIEDPARAAEIIAGELEALR